MKKNFYVLEIEDFLVVLNSSNTSLIIINSEGNLILHKQNIVVWQVRNNYISVEENNVKGVYNYDGSIAVPFEFNDIFITENGFNVKKNKGDDFITYESK